MELHGISKQRSNTFIKFAWGILWEFGECFRLAGMVSNRIGQKFFLINLKTWWFYGEHEPVRLSDMENCRHIDISKSVRDKKIQSLVSLIVFKSWK